VNDAHPRNFRLHYLDEPVLRQKSEPVRAFGDAERALVEAMAELMVLHRGVGLAAPQAGVPARIILVHPSLLPAGADTILVNPEIISAADETLVEEEGCLSLLSIASALARPAKVVVRYRNPAGETREAEAEGLGARALLHEIDHLNGVLYIDRLSRLKRKLVSDRFRKLYRELGLDRDRPAGG